MVFVITKSKIQYPKKKNANVNFLHFFAILDISIINYRIEKTLTLGCFTVE